jgi:hypothetical protein
MCFHGLPPQRTSRSAIHSRRDGYVSKLRVFQAVPDALRLSGVESCMLNKSPGTPDLTILSFTSGFHGRLFGSLSATRSKAIHKVSLNYRTNEDLTDDEMDKRSMCPLSIGQLLHSPRSNIHLRRIRRRMRRRSRDAYKSMRGS